MDLRDLRREYVGAPLDIGHVDPDPTRQFARWLEEARAATAPLRDAGIEAHPMTLATADADGRPAARTVLLRSYDAAGFVFYGDYGSRKGQHLDANPHGALVFHWPVLDRQVRIEGRVTRLSRAASRAYFESRPRGSQISAAASVQSAPIESRVALDAARADLERDVGDGPVPLPDRWGGWRLAPDRVELWQGRENRLHDRLCYLRTADGWRIERLQP